MDNARYFDNRKFVVYRRNGIYQARTSLDGGYIWRTLSTLA